MNECSLRTINSNPEIAQSQWDSSRGSGVIWNGIPFETVVIPAKAGIQSVGGAFPMAGGADIAPFAMSAINEGQPSHTRD
jgi:hypothetical protein